MKHTAQPICIELLGTDFDERTGRARRAAVNRLEHNRAEGSKACQRCAQWQREPIQGARLEAMHNYLLHLGSSSVRFTAQAIRLCLVERVMYRRSDLTLRELSDMLPSNEQRDTIKYLDASYQRLIEQRHYATSDDSEPVDNGDRMIR